jgi:phosphinothricin acetyltransferase
MMEAVTIRASEDRDVGAVAAIYRHHVLHGRASFEEEPPDADELARRRREIVARGLPYLVAEREARVVGYAYAGLYRARSAYRFTLEDSIYVDAAELGRGIGSLLLAGVIERAQALGFRQMVAVVGGGDPASIRLHARLGFGRAGVLSAVGYKFGDWADTVLMQRALGPGAGAPPG